MSIKYIVLTDYIFLHINIYTSELRIILNL